MTDEEQSKEPTAATPAKKRTTNQKKSTTIPASSNQVAAPEPTAKEKTGSTLAVIALILVIVLAVAGGFGYRQLQQQMADLNQGLVEAEENRNQDIEQMAQDLAGLSEQMQAYSEATDSQLELLEQQTSKSKRQWLIVEAEYLASVANVRLQLAGDVNTAMAALRAADQRLKENGNPALFAIRKQIAREIGSLQSADLPDVVGLSSRILSLESRVGALEVTDPHTGVAQAPGIGADGTPAAPEDWEQALKSAWDNFSKMVVVRRNDKPISAMMTPEQVDVIQKNLALKLETARLALVHQDEALYRASLDIVAQWLGDYFDQSKQAVSAALTEVKALRDASIVPELPDISGSLNALRELPLLQLGGEAAIETPVQPDQATQEKPVADDTASEVSPKTEPMAAESAAPEKSEPDSAETQTGTAAEQPAKQ